MQLNEYQEQALSYRLPSADHMYAIINLAGEVGELSSLIAKAIRDGGNMTEFLINIKKELGDVLWHVAAIAADNGFDLESVATANIAKLHDRTVKGTIQGSGDNR